MDEDQDERKRQEATARVDALREEAIGKARYVVGYALQDLASTYRRKVQASPGYGDDKLTSGERIAYRQALYQAVFRLMREEEDRLDPILAADIPDVGVPA